MKTFTKEELERIADPMVRAIHDPEFGLERSIMSYKASFHDLEVLVYEHSKNDFANAAKFLKDLEEHFETMKTRLENVQFMHLELVRKEQSGWFDTNSSGRV